MLEVGYAGMRGTHMLVMHTINQAGLASVDNPIRGETTNTLANIQTRVPYLGFSAGTMYDVESSGFAWYNSLQASLSKRFHYGLQFLASYTFTRDLANVYAGTTSSNGGIRYGDQTNPRRNYGPDSFVRPHRFVFSAVYELPGPKDRHSAVGELLGGWKVTGVVTVQSGHLLPLFTNTATNAYGIPVDFAEIVPGCKLSTSGSVTSRLNNWINQDCLASFPIIGDDGVATGFGNSGMGILHGPGQANTDLCAANVDRLDSLPAIPRRWPLNSSRDASHEHLMDGGRVSMVGGAGSQIAFTASISAPLLSSCRRKARKLAIGIFVSRSRSSLPGEPKP